MIKEKICKMILLQKENRKWILICKQAWLKKLGLFIFISLLLLQVILTPEMQERIRQNRERALAKRRAAHERQAEQTNTQEGED